MRSLKVESNLYDREARVGTGSRGGNSAASLLFTFNVDDVSQSGEWRVNTAATPFTLPSRARGRTLGKAESAYPSEPDRRRRV